MGSLIVALMYIYYSAGFLLFTTHTRFGRQIDLSCSTKPHNGIYL
jgi:hypothetical protein